MGGKELKGDERLDPGPLHARAVPGREALRMEKEGKRGREGGDDAQKAELRRIADRLLDRMRVRQATVDERNLATELLGGVGTCAREEGASADVLQRSLMQRAEILASGDEDRLRRLREVAGKVALRIVQSGQWDEVVEDSVPAEMQPLHMSAVREALGSLIPARLHKTLDKAAKNSKDEFGTMRGESVLCIDGGWRVSVRAEDALARGRLIFGA